jgi:carbonic anhydrase/acetyltransferase-like protein (isoleucine patch superfamily)
MPIVTFSRMTPVFGESVFVDPMATVIGDVAVAARANVWPGAVLRGDTERIELGEGASFQDNSVAHCNPGFPVVIGADAIVGHNVVVHGAVIGPHCLIGMGAILLNGVELGEECIVGAGALLTQGKKYPSRSLILGSPAKVVREVTDADLVAYYELRERYRVRTRLYIEQGLGTDLSAYRG